MLGEILAHLPCQRHLAFGDCLIMLNLHAAHEQKQFQNLHLEIALSDAVRHGIELGKDRLDIRLGTGDEAFIPAAEFFHQRRRLTLTSSRKQEKHRGDRLISIIMLIP